MERDKVIWNLEEVHPEGGRGNALAIRIWQLETPRDREERDRRCVCVTTHPWGVLGGGEHNTVGVANALAARGHVALTFALPSSGLVWGTVRQPFPEP